jgi:hypothetical protein
MPLDFTRGSSQLLTSDTPFFGGKSESEMVAKLENECQNWNKTAHKPYLKHFNLFEKKIENTCRVVVTFMPHVKHICG